MEYYVTSSDLQTASAVIAATGALVHGITLIPAAAASTLTVYDNASAASGTVIEKAVAPASGASVHVSFDQPRCANTGIYAAISGAAAAYIIHYSLA